VAVAYRALKQWLARYWESIAKAINRPNDHEGQQITKSISTIEP